MDAALGRADGGVMLWVPQKGSVRREHNTGTVGTATPGTAVTTGATSATKSAVPAELIAATAFDSYWMTIIASQYGLATAASDGALDILIGAATEEVLIPNLLMGYCGGDIGTVGQGPKRWDFPLYTPAGSRLAAQVAGLRVLTAMRVAIYLSGGNGSPPFRVGSKVTTYGMGTVPNGTAVTPGASGAEGAWAEITAATSENHFALVPSFQVTNDATTALRSFMLDLGIGAATEEEIAQSYWFTTDSNEHLAGPHNSWPCFQDIPSGTRLAMRVSNHASNDAGYDAVIHAVS